VRSDATCRRGQREVSDRQSRTVAGQRGTERVEISVRPTAQTAGHCERRHEADLAGKAVSSQTSRTVVRSEPPAGAAPALRRLNAGERDRACDKAPCRAAEDDAARELQDVDPGACSAAAGCGAKRQLQVAGSSDGRAVSRRQPQGGRPACYLCRIRHMLWPGWSSLVDRRGRASAGKPCWESRSTAGGRPAAAGLLAAPPALPARPPLAARPTPGAPPVADPFVPPSPPPCPASYSLTASLFLYGCAAHQSCSCRACCPRPSTY